ncbi:hypothetical protein F5Y04DRAFT_283881 [Hypomontagnella monticulosa]|nr:hypothetical protein F5Y04DRAFT_283881 [Hypomontagnella monticulosa]
MDRTSNLAPIKPTAQGRREQARLPNAASGTNLGASSISSGHGSPDLPSTPTNQQLSSANWDSKPRMAEKALLCLVYELSLRNVDIPYSEANHRLNPGSSGKSLVHYMGRLRDMLIAEGHMVPPPTGAHTDAEIRGYIREFPNDPTKLTKARPLKYSEKWRHPKSNLADAATYTHDYNRRESQEDVANAPQNNPIVPDNDSDSDEEAEEQTAHGVSVPSERCEAFAADICRIISKYQKREQATPSQPLQPQGIAQSFSSSGGVPAIQPAPAPAPYRAMPTGYSQSPRVQQVRYLAGDNRGNNYFGHNGFDPNGPGLNNLGYGNHGHNDLGYNNTNNGGLNSPVLNNPGYGPQGYYYQGRFVNGHQVNSYAQQPLRMHRTVSAPLQNQNENDTTGNTMVPGVLPFNPNPMPNLRTFNANVAPNRPLNNNQVPFRFPDDLGSVGNGANNLPGGTGGSTNVPGYRAPREWNR